MRLRVRLGIIFVTGPVIAFTLVGGFLGQAVAPSDVYRHLRIFEDVVARISDFYVEKVELEDVMQGALRGLSSGLDSDSAYLSAEDVLRLETGQPLPEGRLGVEISSQYYLQIVAVRDGSPAARAGLLPGDYLRAIDDQTTRLVSAIEGERLLRGEPGVERPVVTASRQHVGTVRHLPGSRARARNRRHDATALDRRRIYPGTQLRLRHRGSD